MNSKHPYEKHLAEKLVQLPPPGDPDQNWQQMKSLLDKNMPRHGGSGPGSSYRWWVTGTVIVAVVAGTWFGGKQLLTREQRNEAVAGKIKTVNNKTAPNVASVNEKSTADKLNDQILSQTSGTQPAQNRQQAESAAPPAAAENTTASVPYNSKPANGGNTGNTDNPAATGASTAKAGKGTTNGLRAITGGNNRSNVPKENTGLAATGKSHAEQPDEIKNSNENHTHRTKLYSANSNNKSKNHTANNTRVTGNHNTGNRNGNVTESDNDVTGNLPANKTIAANRNRLYRNRNNGNANHNAPARRRHQQAVTGQEQLVAGNKNRQAGQPHVYEPVISSPRRSQPSQPSEDRLQPLPVTVKVDYTGTAVITPAGVVQRDFTYYTQSDLFPNQSPKNTSAKHRASKNSGSQEDKTFAAGISLPLAFPLGDQEVIAYNRRANVNTLSDYLPALHLQYHFNNKTYVQTQFQFSAPQFIRPIMLYQTEKQMSPNDWSSTCIYARKLYYFNLPVSIYHSPLPNFYIGTGLQFSSLLSGVAQYQQIQRHRSPFGPYQEYIVDNKFTRFKNDSLSNRFNRNEIRLILDLNYYWNRFTVGLQYNQAFNNYVSFQVTPLSPYTFDKNKSLQFYLRYNIFEDKKRKRKNEGLLTFK